MIALRFNKAFSKVKLEVYIIVLCQPTNTHQILDDVWDVQQIIQVQCDWRIKRWVNLWSAYMAYGQTLTIPNV